MRYEKLVNNFHSFLFYGFIYKPNDADQVKLTLKLDPNDPDYDEKAKQIPPFMH